MRRNFSCTLLLLSISLICKAQWPPTDSSYTLVWGDEFNNTSGYNGLVIDTNKWITAPPWNIDSTKHNLPPHGWVDVPGYNHNLTDTSNVHVYSGTCKLTARKGAFNSDYWNFNVPPYYFAATFKYSNGSLTSKRSLQYGYYELRFKLPGNVTVPSSYNAYQQTFWLYDKSSSIEHSEIDVFEIGGNTNDFTNGGYFRSHPGDSLRSWHIDSAANNISNGAWHTAAINWTQKSIDYYLDGVFLSSHTKYADSLIPMRIFIEAGLPLALARNIPIDSVHTIFPYTYEIDYLRVYQRKEACDTSKTYLTCTASTFNSKLYKDLTLGGSGGNAYFNNGNASALGLNFVLLSEGTTIDNNMTLYMDVIPCTPNVSAYINKTMPLPTNIPPNRN